ncbi:MAG: FtsX-like permease family protein, partial [Chitinophagaceae bacterium]
MYADSSLFSVFDFELLRGDKNTVLKDPFSIVLSETAAKKYFGNADPVGQTVLVSNQGTPAKITGLMKDIPDNSQIRADMIMSMTTITQEYAKGIDNQWGNYGALAFVLLKPNTDAASFDKKLPAFLEKNAGKEMRERQMFVTLHTEKLRDVYLKSARGGAKNGNLTNVYVFSVIAIFILVIACINFVNLTTARSVERAKEVGVRKVVGALKFQLARQFIVESLLMCFFAFLVTTLLAMALLPVFNTMAGKVISTSIFNPFVNIAWLFGASMLIGLLAGIYPAWVLSSFKPITVLKGRFSTSNRGVILRKGLVITQFTISIALIIATIVVYNQMNYMRSKDPGFNKEQLMVFETDFDPAKNAFVQAMDLIPGVKAKSLSSSVPGTGNRGAYSEIENNHGDMQVANLDLYFVDFDYISTLGLKMIAGRAFSKEFGTDTTKAMIINEAAVKMFGYKSPQEAIGRRFKQWGREGNIVGVVKNFNYRSLQYDIAPLTMRIDAEGTNLVSVKVDGKNLPKTIAAVEKQWSTLLPNRPFSYFFLDEFFNDQYKGEERFGSLFLNFAVLAIMISCLGLLGLASYSTIQRTREIGIRKVMGASAISIVNLLSADFLLLVGISFIMATPLAWYFMHEWLQNFSNRINISWWIFAAAGSIALVIAVFTISYQALKAAFASPVRSMRSE